MNDRGYKRKLECFSVNYIGDVQKMFSNKETDAAQTGFGVHEIL